MRDAVVHREVLAPPDLERIFGLVGGSIFQGEQGLDQMAFMRPTPALAQYATPVDGLYLCGAGTHPGGGVMALGGHNAAQRVLHDQRWHRAPPAGAGGAAGMTAVATDLDVVARARTFVEDVLIPLEEEAERARGRLPDERTSPAIRARRHRGRPQRRAARREHGGQGWIQARVVRWSRSSSARSTNALSWHMPERLQRAGPRLPGADRPLPAARAARRAARRLRGDRGARGLGPVAASPPPPYARDGGWVIDGEKWFVTYGDVAAVYIVMATGRRRGRRCSSSTARATASRSSTIRRSRTRYPHGHPTIRFTDVRVGDDAVIGGLGEGDALQRAWFTEERLGIAARGVGAMWRLLEEATAWALSREQGGTRIMDYQGVSFPLADSAADAAAGRALTLEVARLIDDGADLKLVHAKASMAKLFVSEAAYRCADRAVQVFGGRGYMRTNVAERFLRELRVDRIWEGTSEIQRLIVARALERRGVERTLH